MVAGPIALLQPAGEASEEGERAEGEPGWRESWRDDVGVLVFSALVLRVFVPLGMGLRRPVPVDTGVVALLFAEGEGEALKGWKPFMVILGSSSILRLLFLRLGSLVPISNFRVSTFRSNKATSVPRTFAKGK